MSFRNVEARRDGYTIIVTGISDDYPARGFLNPDLTNFPTDLEAYERYDDVPARDKDKEDNAGEFRFEFNVGDASPPYVVKLVNAGGKGESMTINVN